MLSTDRQSFSQKVAAGVYSALMIGLLPWMLIRIGLKAQSEPMYASKILQRLGLFSLKSMHGEGPWIWIHAVSLGESRVAGLLIKAMRTAHPQLRFALTHSTATGMQEGARYLTERDLQCWYPWDVSWCVNSFLTTIKPHLGLLIETEVWPNMVQASRKFQVPLILVNARMSEKSFKSSSRLSALSRPAYEGLSAVWTQSQADAERLKALGADVQGVLGSMKFDAEPDAQLMALGNHWKSSRSQPMVLLASSRPGEEELFLHKINHMPAELQEHILWAIVPRHPQRFDEIAAMGKRLGFECFRRSHWVSLEKMQDVFRQRSSAKTLFIGDSLGEMNFYYASAQVCLLGASFLPFGGQNLIEPMACSCPVVIGPYTYNFEKIAAQAKALNAALSVQSMDQAVECAVTLLNSTVQVQGLKANGLSFVQSQQGATQKTLQALWPMIDSIKD